MREATALTRAGRLAEATALIQRTLGGAAPVRVVPGEIVIDEERLRDDHPPGAPPGAPPGSGGLPADPDAARHGTRAGTAASEPGVDGGPAPHAPGPRCTTGG